jgi:hypothetical protein
MSLSDLSWPPPSADHGRLIRRLQSVVERSDGDRAILPGRVIRLGAMAADREIMQRSFGSASPGRARQAPIPRKAAKMDRST